MFSKRDHYYFQLASKASGFSDFDRVHIGCIAVYKNRVIAVGFNNCRSHPMQAKYNQKRRFTKNDKPSKDSLHAEIHAMVQIMNDTNIDFPKVKLYIARVKLDSTLSMSRPCPACFAMIRDLGIRHIYYTSDTGYSYEEVIY